MKGLIGETTEYDKKEMLERKKPKSWLKSVSAFANGFGGKLLFGVSDSDEVVGLEDFKKEADDLSEMIKSKWILYLKLIWPLRSLMTVNHL